MVGRDIVEGEPEDGLGIVAEQQRPGFSHAPPVALFSGGELDIVKLDRDSAVQQVEAIDFSTAGGKRSGEVGVGNRLLNCWCIGCDAWSVLILALQRKRKRSGNRMGSETGDAVESLAVRPAVIINDRLGKVIPVGQGSA